MNWKQWVDSKKKIYYGAVGFIVAYILTIPWRDYETFVDTSQGVPVWIHFVLIAVGLTVFIVLLKVIEFVVKKTILK